MNRDRTIAIVLAVALAGSLFNGNSIEGFGFGLLIGLVLGALVGAAFVYGEKESSV